MRFVAIGGSSAIGSWVVQRLSARGHNITVVRRLANMDSDTDLACDAAIHMYVMNGPEAEAFVDAFGQRADRLLVISSGDVYRAYGVLHRKEHAAVDPDPLTEEAPLRSVLHLYAEFPEYDKIPVEREVMQAGGSNCVLRLPAVYGPNDSHHRAGAWLKQMNSDQPFTLGESFANWRWTHGYIEDVAEAIALAAMDARSAGRIYNVGEAVTPTMFERIEGLGRAFGWRGKIAVTSDEASPLDYRQPMVMDSSRIRNELGFGELATAEDALQRTIAWEVESGYAQRPP